MNIFVFSKQRQFNCFYHVFIKSDKKQFQSCQLRFHLYQDLFHMCQICCSCDNINFKYVKIFFILINNHFTSDKFFFSSVKIFFHYYQINFISDKIDSRISKIISLSPITISFASKIISFPPKLISFPPKSISYATKYFAYVPNTLVKGIEEFLVDLKNYQNLRN